MGKSSNVEKLKNTHPEHLPSDQLAVSLICFVGQSAVRSRLNRTKHLSDLYKPNKNTEAQNWAKEEVDNRPQVAS